MGYFVDKNTQIALPALTQAPTLDQQQLLHITYPQQKIATPVLIVLQSSPQQIKLTLLSTLGIKLAQAQYDGRHIQLDNHLPLTEMPPANQVLGDILFTLLPVQHWQLPAGWKILEQDKQRTLYDAQQKPAMRVEYQTVARKQPVLVENEKFDYQIKIKTLSTENKHDNTFR